MRQELQEMQTAKDLSTIDDDVEEVATLLEWTSAEHVHRPKSTLWYVALAVVSLVVIAVLVLLSNYFAAIVMTIGACLLFYFAEKQPGTVHYRLMVDGIAVNTLLYHYRDLMAFNIVYYPGGTKAVFLRSKRRFVPLIHLEVGEADPVAIRELLLQFLPEDQELDEPVVDRLAHRLGF